MKTIVIDAGHGGADAGGVSLGTPEKDLALAYAMALTARLEMAGHRVIQTRTTDVFVPLSRRAAIANEAGANLFLSIHANASANPKASGPWTIHAAGSRRGAELASEVQAALARALVGNPAAVYPDASPWVGDRRLAVLRQTKMPAVIIELGFMTNLTDLRRLEDPAVRTRVVNALAGIPLLVSEERLVPPPREDRPLPVRPHPAENDVVIDAPVSAPPPPARLQLAAEPQPSRWERLSTSLRSKNPMREIISRVAAVIAGGILTLIAGTLGIEVTEGVSNAVTEAVTSLGMVIWLLAYAVFHKLIDRRVNPTDAAKAPPGE